MNLRYFSKTNKIKTYAFLILISIFLFAIPKSTNACEIKFDILKGKKEVYEVGDTLMIKVKVLLTHRVCPISLQKTKFTMNGLKVLKSTKWKQVSTMDHERKLITIVKKTKDGKISLTALRTCEKDGGFGALKLKSTSSN